MILYVKELIDELNKHDGNKIVEVVGETILSPEQQIEVLKEGKQTNFGGTIRSVEDYEKIIVIRASDS